MSDLADLERIEQELRKWVKPVPQHYELRDQETKIRMADTIAAYIAAQRERDALIRDLTTIVRMPNAEHEADRHNRAVELLRLSAPPKEPKP